MSSLDSMPSEINIISPDELTIIKIREHLFKVSKYTKDNLVYLLPNTYVRYKTDEHKSATLNIIKQIRDIKITNTKTQNQTTLSSQKPVFEEVDYYSTFSDGMSTLALFNDKVTVLNGNNYNELIEIIINDSVGNSTFENSKLIETTMNECELIKFITQNCISDNDEIRHKMIMFLSALNMNNIRYIKFPINPWPIEQSDLLELINDSVYSLYNRKEYEEIRTKCKEKSVWMEAAFVASYCGVLNIDNENESDYEFCYLNNGPKPDYKMIKQQKITISVDGAMIINTTQPFNSEFINKSKKIKLHDSYIPGMVSLINDKNALLLGGKNLSHVIGYANGTYDENKNIVMYHKVKGITENETDIYKIVCNIALYQGKTINHFSDIELAVLAAYTTMPENITSKIYDWGKPKYLKYKEITSIIVDYDKVKDNTHPDDLKTLDREMMYLILYLPFYIKYGLNYLYLDISVLSNNMLRKLITDHKMIGEFLVDKDTRQIFKINSNVVKDYNLQVGCIYEQLRFMELRQMLWSIKNAIHNNVIQYVTSLHGDKHKNEFIIMDTAAYLKNSNNYGLRWDRYNYNKLQSIMTVGGYISMIAEIKNFANIFQNSKACYTNMSKEIGIKPPVKLKLLDLVTNGVMCYKLQKHQYYLKWYQGKTGKAIRYRADENDVYIKKMLEGHWHAQGVTNRQVKLNLAELNQHDLQDIL